MAISASQVKALRDRSGVGMMDCKKALEESKGDIEKAFDYLRKVGVAKAQKKEGTTAMESLLFLNGLRIENKPYLFLSDSLNFYKFL